MNRIEFIDQFKAATGERVVCLSLAGYHTDRDYESLDVKDWITKQHLEDKLISLQNPFKGEWAATTDGYDTDDVVYYQHTFWKSEVDANVSQPGIDGNWTDILNSQMRFKIPAGTPIPLYVSLAGTILERGFTFKAEIITGNGATTTNGAEGIIYTTSWGNSDWFPGVLNPINGINIYAPPNEAGTGNADLILITLSKA